MFIKEDEDSKIASLEKRMLEFYARTLEYPVYEKMTWRPGLWSMVIEQMKHIRHGTGRILEIGAAKSGFSEYLKERGEKYEVAYQDVTDRCRDHLKVYSDELYFCPVEEISSRKYDVVFHSYVFEHVIRPRRFLDSIGALLTRNGRHVIESPRYDFPFYVPPVIRHLNKKRKLEYIVKCMLNLYPDFTVENDPAIFYLPFRRDYDAVHRVTLKSMKKYAKSRKLSLEEFSLHEKKNAETVVERNLRLRIILFQA